jgi:hypothetical protein
VSIVGCVILRFKANVRHPRSCAYTWNMRVHSVQAYVYVCTHVYVCMYEYARMYVWVCAYVCVRSMHVCMYTYICMSMYVCMCTYAHTSAHAYPRCYAYIHKCTRAYTQTKSLTIYKFKQDISQSFQQRVVWQLGWVFGYQRSRGVRETVPQRLAYARQTLSAILQA